MINLKVIKIIYLLLCETRRV